MTPEPMCAIFLGPSKDAIFLGPSKDRAPVYLATGRVPDTHQVPDGRDSGARNGARPAKKAAEPRADPARCAGAAAEEPRELRRRWATSRPFGQRADGDQPPRQ